MTYTTTLKSNIRKWLTRGQAVAQQSSTLDRKKIFIIPTRAGMVLVCVLIAMLIAALNYNNSLAFIFTFLMTGISLNAMWFTYRQLAGLQLRVQPQIPVFAGEAGEIKFLIENPSDSDRYSLLVSAENSEEPGVFDCAAGTTVTATLAIRPQMRGLYRCNRFRLATRAPLGIFYAWSWQTLDLTTWVYPRPLKVSPLPLEGDGSQKHNTQHPDQNGDHFDSLREHRSGDSKQQISWKHYASKDALLMKQFSSPVQQGVMFSWDKLHTDNIEQKLSQLCQCIIDAEHENQRYGLKLPDTVINANNGESHYRQCLLALAKFGFNS